MVGEYGLEIMSWSTIRVIVEEVVWLSGMWQYDTLPKLFKLSHLMTGWYTHISDKEPQEFEAGLYNSVFRISITPDMK